MTFIYVIIAAFIACCIYIGYRRHQYYYDSTRSGGEGDPYEGFMDASSDYSDFGDDGFFDFDGGDD